MTTEDKLPVKTLALNIGYVETAYAATVFLSHSEGFETLEDALKHLKETFTIGIERAIEELTFSKNSLVNLKSFSVDTFQKHIEAYDNLISRHNTTFVTDFLLGNPQHDAWGEIWETLSESGWDFPIDSYNPKNPQTLTFWSVVDFPSMFRDDI